jgi:hypothetical protein
VTTIKRDQFGRRLFCTEQTAYTAQQRAASDHGCYSGVQRSGAQWVLTFDPSAVMWRAHDAARRCRALTAFAVVR